MFRVQVFVNDGVDHIPLLEVERNLFFLIIRASENLYTVVDSDVEHTTVEIQFVGLITARVLHVLLGVNQSPAK